MKIRYLDGLWYFCKTLIFWILDLVFSIKTLFTIWICACSMQSDESKLPSVHDGFSSEEGARQK